MSLLSKVRPGGRPALFVLVSVLALVLYGSQAKAVPPPTPGQSVVGTGLLPSAPELIINSSGGNDVIYVQVGTSPAAYGAPNVQGGSIANGCASGDTITDAGSPAMGYTPLSRNDQYSFGFTRPALSFSLVVLDWGDYLPHTPHDGGVLGIELKGYDAANNIVASTTFSFTVGVGGINNRPSTLYGDLNSSGDACSATVGQPGRLPLSITAPAGKTITRATLNFVDQQSMDPLSAVTGLQYTLAYGPPTDKDQCKDGGWQRFNVPRKFKNQGDCVSFTNNGR